MRSILGDAAAWLFKTAHREIPREAARGKWNFLLREFGRVY
jgi:hypothetical protein